MSGASDTCGFVVVPFIEMTDARLLATSVAEDDAPLYAAGTTYALGAKVMLAHVVYESLADANLGNTPGETASATFWQNARATNRWRVFDGLNSSRTALGSSAFYELKPGRAIGAAAALSLEGCDTVRARLTDPVAGVVYDKTISVGPRLAEANWWWWAYGERTAAKTQALFLDLPPYYPNAVLRFDIEAPAGGAQAGLLVMGQQRRFGKGTETGTPSRRRNYSYREFDPDYGDLTIVKRPKAREADFVVWLDAAEVDGFVNFIDSRAEDVTLYIGTTADSFERLAVVGIPDTPEEENHSTYSICRLPVRGVI